MVKKMKNNKYRINKKPGNSFYKVNETFFKKINSEISAYWFGLLLADGNMLYDSKKGYSVGLGLIDKEHIKRFLMDIQSDSLLRKEVYGNKRNPFYSVRINNKAFCAYLFEKGMIPNKTKVLTFPTCIPNKYMNHFIRGYWDGDGSYTITKNGYFYLSVVGTKSFITVLAKLLKEKCLLQSLKVEKHTGELYRFRENGKEAQKICDYLYKNAYLFLHRKYEKYLASKKG